MPVAKLDALLGVAGKRVGSIPIPAIAERPAFDEQASSYDNKRVVPPNVGLWRSWERASMAWKRSSVRSRPGPPNVNQF